MPLTVPPLFLFHLISTAGMFGVIWIVQLTHYPTFSFVDPAKFQQFEAFHASSITFIVLPLMLLEAGTGALLLLSGERSLLFLLSLFVLAVIWASTFFIQVPLHTRLGMGFDLKLIEQLVTTNWIRTVSWSIRLFILAALVGTR